jgi:hypothetical protein
LFVFVVLIVFVVGLRLHIHREYVFL